MQLGQLLELIYLFPFMVNQHLEDECLPGFADELMHWLVGPHSVLDCVLSCFYETTLGLIWVLIFLFPAQLI